MSYILVIEDDESISELLNFYVSSKGLTCYSHCRYNEIEACLQDSGRPRLVLLDYILKGEDTEAIVSLIRSYHLDTTICLITAIAEPLTFLNLLGLKYLLTKPFTLDDLDQAIGLIYA